MFPHGFTMPGAPALLFLTYLFLYFPMAALRAARRARPTALPSRTRIWLGSLVMQVFLFVLAWIVGSGFGYEFFAWPAPSLAHAAYTVGAFLLLLVLRAVRRATRTLEDRRGMFVHAIAPRTPGEAALWCATVIVASIAEETAYRGIAMAILWYATGNPWLSAFLCAVAFAVAHAAQGKRSMITIFAVALVMHGLVALTGSLVPAMIVHALYDLVAGEMIRREAMRGEVSPVEA